jgi:signal transduction histidine kinase
MAEGAPFMNRRCRSTAGDAGERILSLNGAPLRLTGAEGVVFTLEDITEVVAAEERKRQVDARMREARRLESLSLFAGGVAHDFNNLLMAVIGNVDLALLDVPEGNPARKSLLEIGAAARKAAALCRQMLTYAGKGSFAAEPMDLNLVAREAARMLAPELPPDIRLRFRLSPSAVPARGDPAQLRQAVVSLLLNASEALAGAAGVVSVGTGTLVVRGAGASGVWAAPPRAGVAYAWVEVTDTGKGMSPDSLEHIFEPFFSTKFMGRGLGLSAVLGIVRGHQGAVRVRSGEGLGTTVQLLLPLPSAPSGPPGLSEEGVCSG